MVAASSHRQDRADGNEDARRGGEGFVGGGTVVVRWGAGDAVGVGDYGLEKVAGHSPIFTS